MAFVDGAGDFDRQAFARKLRQQALPPFGQGRCAQYVRQALEAAGINSAGHPVNAKDYGPFLIKHGFAVVARSNPTGAKPPGYVQLVGDIVVIQATSASPPGHIAGWDGGFWISDFIQPLGQHWVYPGPSYRSERPSYVLYRR